MVCVADDVGAWLTGVLADAGRRKLVTLVLGSDQERELRKAATAAVQAAADDIFPGDAEHALHAAMVISEVFGGGPAFWPGGGQPTLLEGLQSGISARLAVMGDSGVT